MKYRLIFPLIVIFIVFALPFSVKAQDTFGPVCDLTTPGVTCSPTPTSVPPTSVPLSTNTPGPTTIQSLPVAGSSEPTFLLLAISGAITLGGFTSLFSSFTKT